jgi:hypothetical protein
MRHNVESEVERTAPDVFHTRIPQLRIHVDHAPAQNLGAAADRLIVLREKCGPAAKQHATIRSKTVIVEIVFRIVDHAVARA